MSFFSSLEEISIGKFSLASILSTLVVLIICLIVKRIAGKAAADIIAKTHLDKGIKSFLTAAVNVLIWVVIVLIVADSLGIPITSLVAIVSVASLALSLSLQDLLTNIFSGMTILGTKPFTVGDFVDIGGTSGTVRELGLFYTVLATPDGKTVYIPNSTITSGMVINYSSQPLRRLDVDVSASYGEEPKDVISALLMAARTTSGVVADSEPTAFVKDYGSSSIEYTLYAYCKNADFPQAKRELTERIFYVFRERGITMTYDHLNVHLDKE